MKTIIQLFADSVEKYADNPYIFEKVNDRYKAITYRQIREEVIQAAGGLLALGIQKGDRVALLSESRIDWVVSELAILHSGAVCVPLSILLKEGADLKFRLDHSESRWIITSRNQYGKIRQIRQELSTLEKVILLDPVEDKESADVLLDEVKVKGVVYLEENAEKFDEIIHSARPDTIANICYTSGTTADPKGILITHRNYTANIEQTLTLLEVPSWWTTLLILPWDHSFAHTVGIYIMMSVGGSFAAVQSGKSYLDSLKNIPGNIREIRPVFLLSAPSLVKNLRKGIEKGIREKGRLTEKLFAVALKVAYRYNGNGRNRGKGLRIILKPLHQLFDQILFKKIRANFGGRLRFFIGGAALLDLEIQQFFYAIGIPVFQGYGLSEASPVISANVESRHKLGSSGILVSPLELKICDGDGKELPVGEKGEIVIRGENVMKGYWKNEKATRDTLRDGWLYTGDMGYIDHEGFLYVLGRFKSLLIGDDGEKYSPEGIEEAITDHSPLIEQMMLYNNQDKYTTALVIPNKDAMVMWAKTHNQNLHQLKGQEAVLIEIEAEINQYKSGGKHGGQFPARWLPSAIAIIPEAFTVNNGLLNSTGKMVRTKIVGRYKDQIALLHSPEAKDILNAGNLSAIKKLFSS